MLKIICKQLLNRWRSNVWISMELLLVFCLVWYMTDYFFVLQYNRSIPSCRDVSHTWLVDVAQIPELSPAYRPAESDSATLLANFDRVLDRIRNCEGVEELAVMNRGDLPGAGSYYGWMLKSSPDSVSPSAGGQRICFDPRTDYFHVFRITTPDGKPVSVSDFDFSDPKAIVLSQSAQNSLFPGEHTAIGKGLYNGMDAEQSFVVKGVVGDVKRFDYQRPQKNFYVAERTDYSNIYRKSIVIRSSSSVSDARFRQLFSEKMKKELRIGNFYFKRIRSLESLEKETEVLFGVTNNYRVRVALMLFFLLNIMLCVVGTFWYRIRQRREEIGLRMALGSTHASVRRLLYVEGLCLLAVVVVPAMLIEGQFVYLGMIDTLGKSSQDSQVYLPDRLLLRFILTNAITFVLLVAAILVAIWLPADKASRMAPAEALHDE
ncbi:ABC transporter permease [Parabacteroides bouchesdurhonensis]|uniref:ABC transporter permease n=1 Tax=Parabacteroides bouchesdurhonensis TaxID=1936995 RepID=UPI000E4C4FE3|nr:FtsX-like permease family protein [Parabacteroides bouchesdurhonensis]RHJ92432.1 ABC transporter permease [Bacteroides sp. AM07-16]